MTPVPPGYRPAPPGASYDFEGRGRLLKLGLRFQGLRDLHAAALRLAQVLAGRPDVKRAALAVRLPRVSDDRLRREWGSVREVLRPALASRLALVSLGPRPWADPDDPELLKALAGLRGPQEPDRPAASAAVTPKFFDVLKVLLEHRLVRKGPLRIGELLGRSGCSYPTAADALRRLEERGELARRPGRRVELVAFPRRTWSEVLALSASLRRPRFYADRTGRPANPLALVRRLASLGTSGVALGGVLAARHWDPGFDLHGLPRLDLTVHGAWEVASLDPALVPAARGEAAAVAVHPLSRKVPLFEPSKKGPLPVADPVETLLDLHELGLDAQAEALLERLGG
jgi:hypothetical protein